MAVKKVQDVPLRVFVSSTYEDMIDYREAVRESLTNIEQLPVGMEQFVSTPEKSLDVCLSEVRRCQLFIAIVGMRYGSVDDETEKSYSELEYEEAVKNGIPVLAFIIDENECPVLPKFVDTGELAKKLKNFKNTLNNKSYVSRFKSIDNLKELVTRAVKKQVEDTTKSVEKITQQAENDYKSGAETYKRFLIYPGRYKDKEVFLRIRLDNKWSTWLLKEAMFESFKLNRDDAIHCNDGVYVIGCDFSDIDQKAIRLDLFAEGKNADWLLDNGVSLGTVFEGTFKMCFEDIRNVQNENRTVYMAALLLVNGSSVIGKDNEYLSKIGRYAKNDDD
jgi:hypothetical protein